ncbi:MAG: helix-turn-helix domain-containing protein [Bifidobacteriaceae bacterium]|jgi:excisionase family DNA binding protein|nr:helix-turn-helix domain-containing protein [Bifidobacteriaceae bacterium]
MSVIYPNVNLEDTVPPGDSGLLDQLKVFLAGHRGKAVLATADGASAELPDEVYQVIAQAVDALADGSAVSVAPVPTKLSTTQAAEVLGVSRPTLVKMLDDGKIPFEQLNVHRTLRLADVRAFKERRRAAQEATLEGLTRQGAEDGLYEASYADYARALDDARHHLAR